MEQQHGSYQNMAAAASVPPKAINIGDGVTLIGYTDRHAGTITALRQGKRVIEFTLDIAKRTDDRGMSETQEYEYTPDPDGALYVATLRPDGTYKLRGEQRAVMVGLRAEYYDYSR